MSRRNSHVSETKGDEATPTLDIGQAATMFCKAHFDKLQLAQAQKINKQELRMNEKQQKSCLLEYLRNNRDVPYIPLNLNTTQGTQPMYVRLASRVIPIKLENNHFSTVLTEPPTPEELQVAFTALGNPDATVADVLVAWLSASLKSKFTKTTSTLSITKTLPKELKNKKKPQILPAQSESHNGDQSSNGVAQIPASIYNVASELLGVKNQCKQQRELNQRLEKSKQQAIPFILEHLEKNPPERQEQKVSMDLKGTGQPTPYYIHRHIHIRQPSLTLPKAKIVIQKSLEKLTQSHQTLNRLLNAPFNINTLRKVQPLIDKTDFRQDWLTEVIVAKETYCQQQRTTITKVKLDPKPLSEIAQVIDGAVIHEPSRKRKRPGVENNLPQHDEDDEEEEPENGELGSEGDSEYEMDEHS
jgi:hypothetical protein